MKFRYCCNKSQTIPCARNIYGLYIFTQNSTHILQILQQKNDKRLKIVDLKLKTEIKYRKIRMKKLLKNINVYVPSYY